MGEPAEIDGMTIDELARLAGLPVRTIREYQTMRVLPAPRRRGRVGLYGREHRKRLELIARLQRRGYSLAGIRDLLEAWDAGANLPDLLGLDVAPAALDETPLRLTRRELQSKVPGVTDAALRKAVRVGLVGADGPRHFVVRSPALLALVADTVEIGVPLDDMLDLVRALRDQLDELARGLADGIVAGVWKPLAGAERTPEFDAFLQRGRLLLLQGVVSTLADRMGAALLARSADAPDGAELRAAIERVRVGAVADSRGTMHTRRSPAPRIPTKRR
jgi:DNA-binding transcriptional MerR regulator